MAYRLRSRSRNNPSPSPSPSMAQLRLKLTRIVSRHEQMKIAFQQLESQIKTSLREAEDVFASLAIPLTRLVGLKTVEMAEEGRFSTIFMDNDLHTQGYQRSKIGSETRVTSPSAVGGDDQIDQIPKSEEDSYTVKVTMTGKELIQKQKLQLIQLVHLLRQIETQVNSSQNDILQTIADHRASIHKFFQRATAYLSAVHHSSQNHGTFLFTVLKLLQATFNQVGVALRSVEGGVEDLMHELAEQMCNPMVEYVKGLKTEMTSGTCPQLLAIVEEMGGAMRSGRLELEEARKKVRIEEERKLEALSRLKESEERGRTMKEYLGFFLEGKKGSKEHSALYKLLGMGEDQSNDEKLLWELLKKKRKYQIPDSPVGTKELISMGPNNKQFKSTGVRASMHRMTTRSSCLRGLSPQTPCLDSWPPLGSSPSAATHQVLSRKRVTP
ncbi:hypothetical protein F0562_024471 [Nyssa sinensis]|uniref:Uncharacterized protein n=1 Tax=Nyssa sinensis TaxID=561372 RepID=A0A5J5BE19_9ASTE|nr:hypothetical protein F0562_024471 [Nyssa sinensis]